MAYTTTEEATTTNSTIAPTSTTTTKPDENANGKGHRYVGNYEFFKTLGEGSFAKVKLAAHRLTGEKVAIKIIDKDHLPDAYSLRHVHREARIMRMLDHPNVVQLFEVMETKREVMLVVEYAGGGEVLDYIVAHGRLKEAEARKFIREAVDALEHCHNLNVVHRDLKAENLLLDEDLHVKISDFGLSNLFDRSKTLTTCCGSPVYSAPELIEGKRYVGPEVDAWSLGVNLYAMVVGDLPFADSNLAALYDAILKGKYEMPSFLSPECQDLISKLLVVNPKKRYTCSQVRQHPWFTRQDPERKPEPGSAPSLSFPRRPHNESEIDQIVLDRIEAMGFDRRLVVVSVLEGRFDSAAGTYFSLARKKARDVEAFEKEAGTKTSGRATIAATGATHSRRASIDTTSEELAKLLISVERTRIADTRKSPDDNLSNVPAKQKRTARRGREREDSVGKGSNMSIKDIGGGEADLPTQTLFVPTRGGWRGSSGDALHVPKSLHPVSARRHSEQWLSEDETGAIAGTANLHSKTRLPSTKGLDGSKKSSRPSSLPPIARTGPEPDSSGSLRGPTGATYNLLNDSNAALTPPVAPSATTHPTPITRTRSRTIAIDESLYLSRELETIPSDSCTDVSASTQLGPRQSISQLKSPRTIRFAFNCSTTTTLPPATLFERLSKALDRNGVEYESEGFLCACQAPPPPTTTTGDACVRFEAEVCKLPGLKMCGLRLKRLAGDMWEYKRICQAVTRDLNL